MDEKRDALQPNTPQQDAPQQDAPQQDAPQQDAPQQGAPQQDAPQQGAPQPESAQGITFIDLGANDPRVIAMRIEGHVEEGVMQPLFARLDAVTAAGQRALLYVDLVRYGGFDAGVVREKLARMRSLWGGVERVAYLVEESWLRRLVGLIDAITPMHIRGFSHAQADAARAWLLSGEDPGEG